MEESPYSNQALPRMSYSTRRRRVRSRIIEDLQDIFEPGTALPAATGMLSESSELADSLEIAGPDNDQGVDMNIGENLSDAESVVSSTGDMEASSDERCFTGGEVHFDELELDPAAHPVSSENGSDSDSECLTDLLAQWAVTSQITHKHLASLLRILRTTQARMLWHYCIMPHYVGICKISHRFYLLWYGLVPFHCHVCYSIINKVVCANEASQLS